MPCCPSSALLRSRASLRNGLYYLATTSKMLTPGLRIGYVLTPPGQVDVVTQAIRSTTWAASPLTAELATRSIQDGSADAVLDARRREARSRQRMARDALQGLDYDAHPSGYHLWLKLPEPWRSDTFSDRLRRRGVAVTPSEAFVVGRGATPHVVRLAPWEAVRGARAWGGPSGS